MDTITDEEFKEKLTALVFAVEGDIKKKHNTQCRVEATPNIPSERTSRLHQIRVLTQGHAEMYEVWSPNKGDTVYWDRVQ